jgi:hypothetical protein
VVSLVQIIQRPLKSISAVLQAQNSSRLAFGECLNNTYESKQDIQLIIGDVTSLM